MDESRRSRVDAIDSFIVAEIGRSDNHFVCDLKQMSSATE